MIKFAYSTDWHTRGQNPGTRLDDYPSTIEAKIRSFFRIGHEYGVDAFLNGGDYFDSPYLSSSYVIRIGKLIEEELKGKKMYGIWGNHDVIGYNPNTIKQTAQGVFQEFSSYFEILGREPIIFEANGQKVKLSGVSSYAQLDRHILDVDGNILHPRSRDYMIEESDGTPHIHIVHGYATEKPILEGIPHTVISEFYETKATVTLGAHEHTGTSIIRLKYGLFGNPGALSRLFASHSEMNRMPKFYIVTIHDDGTPEIEVVFCPIAKEGHLVMDRTLLDEKKRKEALLAEAQGNIVEALRELDIQGIDVYSLLDKFKDQVSPPVMKDVERRLGIRRAQ